MVGRDAGTAGFVIDATVPPASARPPSEVTNASGENKRAEAFAPALSYFVVQLLACEVLAVRKLCLAVILVHECDDVDADFLRASGFTFTMVGA